MCRRCCFVFALLCCLWCCAAPAMAAEVEPVADDLTAEQLYQLVGIDPDDEEAVQLYLVWLSSLECGGNYQDFGCAYALSGYDPAGQAASYAAFCVLHEYEPDLHTVTQNQYYTKYTGEDVALTYYKTADYGYPPGSWILGTTGKTGTNGYFETRIINLTEMQEEIKNAVTYSDLSPLTTILNTINTNILAGNKTMTNYLPGISSILNLTQKIQPDVADINTTLGGLNTYLRNTSASILSYNGTGGSTGNSATGLINVIANGVNAVTGTQSNIYTHWRSLWSPYVNYLQSTQRQSISYTPWSYDDSIPIAGVGTYSGFIDIFHDDFRKILAVSNDGLRNVAGALTGLQQSSITYNTFNPDGSAVQEDVMSSYSILPLLSFALDRLILDADALRFVLADEDAIRLHIKNKPLEGAIEDNFTDGADAAPSISDISDAAGITSGVKTAIGTNPVSPSEFFYVFEPGQEAYMFFSPEVEMSLDVPAYEPASAFADEDIWSDYEFDADGFATLRDKSAFSFSAALGGGSK